MTVRMRWPALNRQHPLARGLVVYYPIWEGPGSGTVGNVVNPDPKVLRGTLPYINPATDYVPGPPRRGGWAVDFGGASSQRKILVPVSLIVNPVGFSFSCWVNSPGGTQPLWHAPAGSADAIFTVVRPTHAEFTLLGLTDPSALATPGGSTPANTWLHVAGTYDGATQNVYINGRLRATRANTGNISTVQTQCSFGGSAGHLNWSDGKSTDFMIHSRALLPLEIQLLANGHSPLDLRRDVYPAAVAGGTTNPFSLGAVNLLQGKLSA